jgi:hypothetical protein
MEGTSEASLHMASVLSDRRAPTTVAPSARTLIVSGLSGCRLLRNGCRSNELLKELMVSTGEVFPRRRDQISDQYTLAAEVWQWQAETPEPGTGDTSLMIENRTDRRKLSWCST